MRHAESIADIAEASDEGLGRCASGSIGRDVEEELLLDEEEATTVKEKEEEDDEEKGMKVVGEDDNRV